MQLFDKNGLPARKLSDFDPRELRGARLNEIRKDLQDRDMDDKLKIHKYGAHLNWFMDKIKYLTLSQEQMLSGQWNKSLMALGLTNGLILAMAIFVEEQNEPPYQKIPEGLEGATDKIVDDAMKSFVINLVNQIESVICVDEKGSPKGYDDGSKGPMAAYFDWLKATIDRLEEYQFNTPEVHASIDRIKKYLDQNPV